MLQMNFFLTKKVFVNCECHSLDVSNILQMVLSFILTFAPQTRLLLEI